MDSSTTSGMNTTQEAAQQQRAAAIRATLEQMQAELDAIQSATEETLTRVQAELRRSCSNLAEAQMELTYRQAWQKGEEGGRAV